MRRPHMKLLAEKTTALHTPHGKYQTTWEHAIGLNLISVKSLCILQNKELIGALNKAYVCGSVSAERKYSFTP